MKRQGFIKGAAIMAAASVICKFLSAVFKIPLDRFFLHEEGIAVFQSVCSVYNVFLAICVTGIPIALSTLVARAEDKEAATICKSTLYTVTAFCSAFAVAIFVFSEQIATLLSGGGGAPASMALKMAAIALPFLGMISAGRGFFQGKSNMVPSALSQISESFIKAVLGTGLCAAFIGGGIASGAAGAVMGVSLGAISSAAILFVYYRKNVPSGGCFSKKAAFSVIKLSLPVTLGAFGYTAAVLIDALSVNGRLASIGIETMQRLNLFGYLSRANTIYNLPATIITAVTLSAVPLVAKAVKKGEMLTQSVQSAVKMIFLVASPCAFGLMLFAREIFILLYSQPAGWYLLEMTGIIVLVVPYVQATSAMLQASNKVWSPIWATGISVVIKIALNLILIPKMGIEGAPLATVLAFAVAFVINTFLFKKELIQIKFIFTIIKILLCSLVSCGASKLIFSLWENMLAVVGAIIFAAFMYAVLLKVFKLVTIEEIKVIRREDG